MNKKSAPTTRGQVEQLRGTIRALQAERDALAGQRRSRDDVRALVESLVDRWHAQGCDAIERELQRAAAGGAPDLLTLHGAAVVPAAPSAAPVALDLAPVLVGLLGAETVLAALLSRLDAVPEGTPPDARRERLAAIAAQLDGLERDEEKLIESSDFEGEPIERRADARPEIVLAVPE